MTATPDAYFERMWAGDDDPWEHGTRWYETRKYDLTVAALPAARYRRAFEPGCGAGWLTERLAARCDAVLAHERHRRGADVTRGRCAHLPGVEVAVGTLPGDWPAGRFDLVVLSEVLYYLTPADVDDVLARAAAATEPGAHLVAVHYRPAVAEHARPGDEVHAQVVAAPGWVERVGHVEDEFLLAVLERR